MRVCVRVCIIRPSVVPETPGELSQMRKPCRLSAICRDSDAIAKNITAQKQHEVAKKKEEAAAKERTGRAVITKVLFRFLNLV